MEYLGEHTYRLQSGVKFDAGYGGVIGLGPDGTICIGYDGWLAEEITLRPGEEEEVCAWMALQWTKAAERARRALSEG